MTTEKQASRLSDDELTHAIEEVDSAIGERGTKIAALRKEQRSFLDEKDVLVLEQTNRIRASGPAQNLGDN